MRIVRFSVDGSPARFGVLDEHDRIHALDRLDDPGSTTGESVAADAATLHAPIPPTGKIIGVGRNYAAHAAELGNEVPDRPLLFFKPLSALVDPGRPIVLPAFSDNVQYEAELVVVIGRTCKNVAEGDAASAILGYTVANDVTARDIQKADVQFTRGKGFDTSCPLGPWIETDFDPRGARVRAHVDGELRQDGTTDQLVFGIPHLVSYISAAFTLHAGDVILTGTPPGVGPLFEGQSVTVAVEGLGELTNPVVAEGTG
ncbi:fumarylacetoacetate hydrolase family protein [Prauserella cavernicola]|uniref:Fumarylacetoacetate hydrolase family protein n=1 Tax=Prauserella cavernicola TaxID=2800127 RepID=A0A934QLY6_9PSEU|nr:fumarylacetoacetate hydrolase family protein [Prauserella cavernicola]MBK1783877.1 fumarylacetoacetate hydrolase family protein [Prauserella cavernicola]